MPEVSRPNRTATVVPREQFDHVYSVFALRVPGQWGNFLRTLLKNHALRIPGVRGIVKVPTTSGDRVCALVTLLLRYLATKPDELQLPGNLCLKTVDDAEAAARMVASAAIEQYPGQLASSDQEAARRWVEKIEPQNLTVEDVIVGYDLCSAEQVLRKLLPSNVTVPTGYETVGSIVHVNLRDEHEDYKNLIGEVLLDKVKSAQTIVNKMSPTGGQYRTFDMEVIAGKENFITSVRENGCIFHMDYSQVYWNSKQETEHRRIVDLLKPGDIVADGFAGIGPFAVPAAKRGFRVYANDLNPRCVEYMDRNIGANKVDRALITTSCGCARDFYRRLVESETPFTVVVMNFPSGALSFLDVFRGAYQANTSLPLPIIHAYCFISGEEYENLATEKVKSSLFDTSDTTRASWRPANIRVVRDVAPGKRSLCVSFPLPPSVAYHTMQQES